MGANCSCLSNRIFYSDIQIAQHSKFQNYDIITNNIPKYLSSLIKIQSTVRGHLFRKKQNKPIKLLLSKTSTKTSYIVVNKTNISQDQVDNLFKTYQPLFDGIKVTFVQLGFPNQAEYSGEWNPVLKERHGRGIQVWLDSTIYMGQWKNDKTNGKGKIVHPNGGCYEGNFCQDHAEGFGTYVHKNGCRYDGTWKNDLQDGNGKETWPNKLVYEGEYKEGKKNGKGKLTLADGSVYIGDFHNNKIHGFGKYVWTDKRQYEGEFKNNKMDGEGEFKWPDGRCYKGHYFDDEKNGFGEFSWPNGKKYRGLWKNGKQHGEGELYSISEQVWKKGLWNEGRRVRWNDA